MWDEGPWWYAAPIGALSVNDNCIDFYVQPGKKGQNAIVNYFQIQVIYQSRINH